MEFTLPTRLTHLIAIGAWPSGKRPAMSLQELNPLVASDRVKLFAEDETVICLELPPFRTIAAHMALAGAGDFWERFGALSQINPEQALIIGDFGIGSDSPIILHFAANAQNPPVLRLRWGPLGEHNEWVQGARDFDEFANMLGLGEPVA